MKVLRIAVEGKRVEKPRWTKETPEERLASERLPTFTVFGTSDRTDPRMHMDIMATASIIRSAAGALGVSPEVFTSEFNFERSDHEDNMHTIHFLPKVKPGVLAHLQFPGDDEPHLVMVIAEVLERQGVVWEKHEPNREIRLLNKIDLPDTNARIQFPQVDGWVVASVIKEVKNTNARSIHSAKWEPGLVIGSDWFFVTHESLTPIDFAQW